MAEVNLFAVPAIVDPGGLDLQRPGAGGDRAGPGEPVAHHQAPSGGVEDVGMGLEVGPALGCQCNRQHLLGGQTADLVQADGAGFFLANRVVGGVMD